MGKRKNKNTGNKSGRLGKNTFVRTVIEVFAKNPFSGFTIRQVCVTLGINDKASKQLVNNIIEDLLQNKVLVEGKRGKYQIHPDHVSKSVAQRQITGVVDMKSTGKAYIISKELDEDVFISASNTKNALDGDIVKVFLFPKRRGRKLEGQISEVIERKKQNIVGTLQITKHIAFLIPDNTSIPVDIFIPKEKVSISKNGMKAVARITDWPAHAKNPFGEIIKVLGKPGDNDVEMNSILAEYEFPLGFPENVEKEADKIREEIPAKEYKKRKDFREIATFTIDPHDAKDFDDALSFKKLDNGNYEIGVHIADVSYYVKPGSALDDEAYKRATSVYLVDRVIPMLPEKLSNKVCSLRPNEEKLCFSVVFEMGNEAKIHKHWIGRTVIFSDRRFNYDEVQEIIEGKHGDFKEEILILNSLAKKLRDERFRKGSIAFRSQEVKFQLDDDGKPIGAYVKEQKDSNKLIEDFMLLANRTVSEEIGKPKKNQKEKSKTFVYRIHDVPNSEKLQTFSEFVAKLGYRISLSSRRSIATSLNKLFEDIAGKAEENMIETIAVRTMAKAKYSTDNIGHYGLAFPYYSHFTSPIRRYPDLIVHRLLEKYFAGEQSVNQAEYEDKCEHCTDMEIKATEAERASVKYKQAEFLLDKVGEEFNGVISGVSKWGIFVELDGNKCEGMVSMKSLVDDFYYLDEDNYRILGQKYGFEYKLGDPIKIRVKRIDLQKKQMDFELA